MAMLGVGIAIGSNACFGCNAVSESGVVVGYGTFECASEVGLKKAVEGVVGKGFGK